MNSLAPHVMLRGTYKCPGKPGVAILLDGYLTPISWSSFNHCLRLVQSRTASYLRHQQRASTDDVTPFMLPHHDRIVVLALSYYRFRDPASSLKT